MLLMLLLIFLPVIVQPLQAILDGRVTPIFLDTNYGFSNFEWARGEVHFLQGFTVPPNTTAILGLTAPVLGANLNLDNGGDASNQATILLETPLTLHVPVFTGGVRIGSIDGSEGKINLIAPAGGASASIDWAISDQITFITDMAIDFGTLYANFSGGSSGPLLRPSLFINASTPKKLRLMNGTLFVDGAGTNNVLPRIIAGDVSGGRHQLLLEDMTLRFVSTSITFTNLDIVSSKGINIFSGSPDAQVNFYSGLKICNESTLVGPLGLSYSLTPSIVSNDYFQIEPRGTLLLNNNTLSFNRPLRLPYAPGLKNTYPRIVVSGTSTLRGIGIGTNNTVQLGIGVNSTYTSDGIIDIQNGGTLILDNVALVNKNVRF